MTSLFHRSNPLRSNWSVCNVSNSGPWNPNLTLKVNSLWIKINSKQHRRSLEVGCPKHPGASTIGSQLQDGDCTDGWQNLTTQPWAPTPSRRTSEPRWLGERGSWPLSKSPESPNPTAPNNQRTAHDHANSLDHCNVLTTNCQNNPETTTNPRDTCTCGQRQTAEWRGV